MVELALENHALGQKRASDTLRNRGVSISAASGRCVWLRHGLKTFVKLYTTKHPINFAELLNDRVLPFLKEQSILLLRILTNRGTEFYGQADTHDYELYLALIDIEHTRTRNPRTIDICERFHKTILG